MSFRRWSWNFTPRNLRIVQQSSMDSCQLRCFSTHDSRQNWQGIHLQKLTKKEETLSIMDWIDLLMQIEIDVLYLEIDGDLNIPLPWRTDISNSTNRPPYPTTCSSRRQPRQNDAAILPITAPDRFDVVAGRGQGVQRLHGNEAYRKLISMNKVRRYCLQLN
jgi:hypothetical protein